MPKIDTTVELNAQEQALCLPLGKKRYCNNRAAGVKNAKRGRHSDAETDLEGVAAQNQGRAVTPIAGSYLHQREDMTTATHDSIHVRFLEPPSVKMVASEGLPFGRVGPDGKVVKASAVLS
jgi:hypothetical protein